MIVGLKGVTEPHSKSLYTAQWVTHPHYLCRYIQAGNGAAATVIEDNFISTHAYISGANF